MREELREALLSEAEGSYDDSFALALSDFLLSDDDDCFTGGDYADCKGDFPERVEGKEKTDILAELEWLESCNRDVAEVGRRIDSDSEGNGAAE